MKNPTGALHGCLTVIFDALTRKDQPISVRMMAYCEITFAKRMEFCSELFSTNAFITNATDFKYSRPYSRPIDRNRCVIFCPSLIQFQASSI